MAPLVPLGTRWKAHRGKVLAQTQLILAPKKRAGVNCLGATWISRAAPRSHLRYSVDPPRHISATMHAARQIATVMAPAGHMARARRVAHTTRTVRARTKFTRAETALACSKGPNCHRTSLRTTPRQMPVSTRTMQESRTTVQLVPLGTRFRILLGPHLVLSALIGATSRTTGAKFLGAT
jgi:hypothetical protein